MPIFLCPLAKIPKILCERLGSILFLDFLAIIFKTSLGLSILIISSHSFYLVLKIDYQYDF